MHKYKNKPFGLFLWTDLQYIVNNQQLLVVLDVGVQLQVQVKNANNKHNIPASIPSDVDEREQLQLQQLPQLLQLQLPQEQQLPLLELL